MTFQHCLKVFLVSGAAACCIGTAQSQEVFQEVTGTVQSVQGGFGDSSDQGKSVTIDFAYDSGIVNQQLTATGFSLSSPITSAMLTGGPFGSNINLDWNGMGTITDDVNLFDQSVTVTASTSLDPPTTGFSGDVYGFSLVSNTLGSTLDLFKDVYNGGSIDTQNSGVVKFSDVNVGAFSAPEIDPSTALAAFALLAGGLATLGGWKRTAARTL